MTYLCPTNAFETNVLVQLQHQQFAINRLRYDLHYVGWSILGMAAISVMLGLIALCLLVWGHQWKKTAKLLEKEISLVPLDETEFVRCHQCKFWDRGYCKNPKTNKFIAEGRIKGVFAPDGFGCIYGERINDQAEPPPTGDSGKPKTL